MTIGVEVTGGYDKFGKSAAIRTLLVEAGKSSILATIFLPTPIPNALIGYQLEQEMLRPSCDIVHQCRIRGYNQLEGGLNVSFKKRGESSPNQVGHM